MISVGDHQLFRLAFGDAARLLAADGADVALQVANAGFARVVADDVADRFLRKFDLLRSDSVLFDLPRNQVLESDVDLFFFRVALQFDDLHAVAQRLGDGIEHVRRGDEQHLRQDRTCTSR